MSHYHEVYFNDHTNDGPRVASFYAEVKSWADDFFTPTN